MDQGFDPSVVWIDGVPVVSAPLEKRATATLLFSVGSRDETPRTAGLAHLIEHVVMRRVGRVAAPHNASTGADSIQFFVTGTDSEIVDFLDRVTRAIAWLPDCTESDVAPERRTVGTELGPAAEQGAVGPLTVRYGLADLGIVDAGQRTYRTLPVDAIHDFARRFLHRGNAAVTLTGAVPDGLRLHLPHGERRPTRQVPATIRRDLPGITIADSPPLTLSFELPGAPAVARTVIAYLEASVMRVLRQERQLIYAHSVVTFGLDDHRRVVCFAMDPSRDDLSDALETLVVEFREIGQRGPVMADLEHARESLRSTMGHPGAFASWLTTLATAEVRGRRDELGTFDEEMAKTLAVGAEEIRDAVAAALPTMLVTVGSYDFPGTPEWLNLPPLAYEHRLIPDRIVSPILGVTLAPYDVLLPRARRGLRGYSLFVSDESIAEIGPGGIFEAPLADVVVAGRLPDGAVNLATSTGRQFFIRPSDWRDPWRRIERVLKRIPEEHWYERAQ